VDEVHGGDHSESAFHIICAEGFFASSEKLRWIGPGRRWSPMGGRELEMLRIVSCGGNDTAWDETNIEKKPNLN